MATESKKRLALAIIDFLSTSLKDGTLSSEDQESIEVAQSCIAESFKVDPNDKAAIQDAIGGQNLLSIYSVYEKLKGKNVGGAAAKSSPKPAASSTKSATPAEATPEQKKEADTLKGQGNAAMAKKDYTTAIDYYTKALDILPDNPIFLSNRAAAYSASQNHEKAMIDAQAAVEADPKYTKAWSRLGLAKFALGDTKGSMEAYQKGIDYEGNGGSEAMKRGYETARRKFEEETAGGDDDLADFGGSARSGPGAGGAGGMPDLAGLASMLGGGGGGGGGGMPDLGSLMSNPMFASMAQNLMSNPSIMNDIMSNPRLREMADSFGGGGGGAGGPGAGRGGGMPDLSSLMSDPSIAEMAKKYMGGAGGPGAGGPGAGRGGGRGGGAA